MSVTLAVQPRKGETPQPVWDAAVNLGRKFLFEEPHGMQVGRIALSLFDQLAGPLQLDREDRRLLMVAAVLHDIGKVVNEDRHHLHSFYLISHSALAGFSADERQLIGQIARYHRKSVPQMQHAPFARLNRRHRGRVVRLSSLLRLADALDRDHFQRVDEVHAYLDGSALTLLLEGSGSLSLEMSAVVRSAGLFTRVFGRPVRALRTTAGNASRGPVDPAAIGAEGGVE